MEMIDEDLIISFDESEDIILPELKDDPEDTIDLSDIVEDVKEELGDEDDLV